MWKEMGSFAKRFNVNRCPLCWFIALWRAGDAGDKSPTTGGQSGPGWADLSQKLARLDPNGTNLKKFKMCHI